MLLKREFIHIERLKFFPHITNLDLNKYIFIFETNYVLIYILKGFLHQKAYNIYNYKGNPQQNINLATHTLEDWLELIPG